jgi:hypothetical protein
MSTLIHIATHRWSETIEQSLYFASIGTGEGVLLGCVAIALVLLYGHTKDRWDWSLPFRKVARFSSPGARAFRHRMRGAGKLSNRRWIVFVGCLALTTILGFLAFKKSRESLASSIEPSFYSKGVLLGMSHSDVKVLLGSPKSIDSMSLTWVNQEDIVFEAWHYDEGPEIRRMYFLGGRVVAMNVTENYSKVSAIGYRKGGEPSQQMTTSDGLVRLYFCKRGNFYYEVMDGRIAREGRYDPKIIQLPTFLLSVAQSEEDVRYILRELSETE